MTLKELFGKIEDYYYGPETAVTDDGVKVSISLSPELCTVKLASEIPESLISPGLIEEINAGQALSRYDYKDGELTLKTTLWVDGKPTKSGLLEVTNLMLAQYHSVRSLIGGIPDAK